MTRRALLYGLAAVAMLLGLTSAVLYLSLVNAPEARGAPLQADPVTAVTVTLSDLKAGAASQYTIQYTTSAAGALASGGGQILIQFPAGTTIPVTMAANTISVTTNANITPPTKVLTVAPSINTSTRTVTITTPIVIANSDVITVVFTSTAGLKNPTAPQAYGTTASTRPLIVTTTADTVDASPGAAYNIGAFVSFTPTAGAKRGETVTVVGGGLAPSTTGSITIGGSATILGSAAIDASGDFSGTFVASADSKDGGRIAVTDGAGNLVSSDGAGCGITCIAAATPLYVQLASGTPRVTSVAPGATVEVDLFDFTVNVSNVIANNSTTLGGATVASNPASSFAIASGASAQFSPYKFLVPLGTSAGTKNVVITESGGGGTKSATFQLTVTAPATGTLILSPTTAVAGQTIAITGTGFSPTSLAGGAGPNGVHQITGQSTVVVSLGGTTLTTPSLTYPINLDSNGNFVVSVNLPVNSTTLSAGSQQVKVIDSGGRTGTTNLTIPARTITLNPASSGRGSEVEVTGVGFAAGNNSVIITYAGIQVANVAPDDKGDFQVTFNVPFSANIPSSNNVTAALSGLVASASATHTVPGASVTVSPSSAETGFLLVVIGSNFPGFGTLSSLTVGGVSALPLPAPTTDRDGNFTASFMLPEAPIGTQTVRVTVGTVSAVTSVTVTKPLITAPTPTPTPQPPMSPAVALKPLLDTSSLIRVWNFNNSTKLWTFFDPRAAFADANTITEMVSGQVYWINSTLAQTVTLNGKSRGLTDGWNLLSW